MYKVNVNDNFQFNITKDQNQLTLNGEPIHWDLIKSSTDHFNIIWNNKSFNVEVVKADYAAKTMNIKINGRYYGVVVKDRFDLLLKELGMEHLAEQQVADIKAPMPGLVIRIDIVEGQEVKKGDPVLVLEAMKMENVIKSPGDGKVKSIKVKQGTAVEKNVVMVEMED